MDERDTYSYMGTLKNSNIILDFLYLNIQIGGTCKWLHLSEG